MIRAILPLIFFISALSATCQFISSVPSGGSPDITPEYPGGRVALLNFLSSELSYPEIAVMNGIEGRVYIEFTVSEQGEIENYSVIKGLGYGLDEEAIRMVEAIPEKFTPAKKNKEPISVKMIMPIRFDINASAKDRLVKLD